MNFLRDFFVINPAIYEKRKKYIWFERAETIQAQGILEFFVEQDIYIDGFATNIPEDEGVYIWNKRICFIDNIEKKDSLILSGYDVGEACQSEKIFVVNPSINKQSVAVYGAGHDGLHFLHAAEASGIAVRMFIDSDSGKTGQKLEGVAIYGTDVLKRLPVDMSVVIAVRDAYDEIDQTISDQAPDLTRYRYNYRTLNDFTEKRILLEGKEIFCTNYIGRAREVIRNKKVFVYGTSERSRKIARIYELLDFCVKGLIDDGTCEDNTISIEEVLYESDFFVLISRKDYQRLSGVLEDLDLVMLRDVGLDNPFQVSYVGMRDEILDINLGHSFVGKQGVCGFSVIGNQVSPGKRIVVLGASTTEGELYSFKSWPEFLYKQINRKDVTIYNGSVATYTSAHELIKLIRDVMFLKPDLVIAYDGALDMLSQFGTENPFAFDELKRAMDFAYKYRSEIWLDHFSEIVPPYSGLEVSTDLFNIWLGNIKKMKAICESEQIRFYSFFQPTLFYKKKISKEERGLLWSSVTNIRTYEKAEEFKKRFEEISEQYRYIYDLSDIFDNKQDIYIDECHVFEKGNQLIAEAVYQIISTGI